MSTKQLVIWVACNLHPQRADGACPRCQCARDVNRMNWSWTAPAASQAA